MTTITRAMQDMRRGGRVRCWDVGLKRYRWFFAVDAKELVQKGLCILAVTEQGQLVDVDPKTGAQIGVSTVHARKEYLLAEYSTGELQQMAQKAGSPFMGLSREQVLMRLENLNYKPDFEPQAVIDAQMRPLVEPDDGE